MGPTPRHRLSSGPTRAIRQFTDRDDLSERFFSLLRAGGGDEPRVMVFHGVGGIGKTRLRRELTARTRAESPSTVVLSYDLDTGGGAATGPEQLLFSLRSQLRSDWHVELPTFDVAYASWWKKARPGLSLSKESLPLLEEGSLIASLLSTAGDIPIASTVAAVVNAADHGSRLLREWYVRRGHRQLDEIDNMEALEILDWLPAFFSSDFAEILKRRGLKAVVFLDTYEALFVGAERSRSALLARDDWVRELAASLPDALWVICSRERLLWVDADASWAPCLEHHLVGSLSAVDARDFLRSCGIDEAPVSDAILASSQGVPHLLDLAVDTFWEIRDAGGTPAAPDFDGLPTDAVNRLTRYLSQTEHETLKVISCARAWDSDLFGALVERFSTGFPVTAMRDLERLSFVLPRPDGGFELHGLVREALRSQLDSATRTSIHRFLFERYDRLIGCEPRYAATPGSEAALVEAFYHASQTMPAKEMIVWFRERQRPFRTGDRWRLLLPLYEQLVDVADKHISPDSPEALWASDSLARFYRRKGRYRDAEPIYRANLEVERASQSGTGRIPTTNNLATLLTRLGRYAEADALLAQALQEVRAHPEDSVVGTLSTLLNNHGNCLAAQGRTPEAAVAYEEAMALESCGSLEQATTLSNIGCLESCTGNLADAEARLSEAVRIHAAQLPPDHPTAAVSQDNLAAVYQLAGRTAEAEALYRQCLRAKERNLGIDHPETSFAQHNLATLLRQRGDTREAEALLENDLRSSLKAFGEGHPFTAVSKASMALVRLDQGRIEEAERLTDEALHTLVSELGESHVLAAVVMFNRATILAATGRGEHALSVSVQALKTLSAAVTPDHPWLRTAKRNTAALLVDLGDAEAAVRLLAKRANTPDAEPAQ